MTRLTEDTLKLKAAIELGSEYLYTIKNGGHGPTLVVDAGTRAMARIAREKIPDNWEGFYVLIIYSQAEEDDTHLYDPNLS